MLEGSLIGTLGIPDDYCLFGVIAHKRSLIQDEADEPLIKIGHH